MSGVLHFYFLKDVSLSVINSDNRKEATFYNTKSRLAMNKTKSPFQRQKTIIILDFFNSFGSRDISLPMIATVAIANIQLYLKKICPF